MKLNTKEKLQTYGLEKLLKYIHKDPETNLIKAVNLARKISPNAYQSQINVIEEAVTDPNHVYHPYILNLLNNVDPDVFDTFVTNFLLNANISYSLCISIHPYEKKSSTRYAYRHYIERLFPRKPLFKSPQLAKKGVFRET